MQLRKRLVRWVTENASAPAKFRALGETRAAGGLVQCDSRCQPPPLAKGWDSEMAFTVLVFASTVTSSEEEACEGKAN